MSARIEIATHPGRFVPSEEGLKSALRAAQAGIWEWHLDTNQNLWSDDVWQLYGLPNDVAASFDSWLYSIHPEDRTHARQTVSAASQCRVPFEVEWRTNPAIGPERWIMSRGQPGKPNGHGCATYTGIVMDITARKRAEHAAQQLTETLEQRVAERTAALAEHERLLQNILDGIPGLVGYWTQDLTNRFANKSYSEWFGSTPDQIRNKNIKDLLGPELFKLNWPHMQNALAGKRQRFERRLPIPGKPGEFRYSEAHYLPDMVDGEVRGFLAIVFDISQIKHAELAAEAANLAKSAFLANISHEVRTPLNAMFGLAQVGARNAAGTPAERTFEQILESAKHMLTLVNDVLDFSKIEAGKMTLNIDRVDLAQVLEHLLTLKAVRAQAKGLSLRIVESPKVPQYFLGDGTRLSQVLLNLLSNAIKFTDSGEVCLTLDYSEPDLIVSVQDTGIGINPRHLGRLFHPFEQLHPRQAAQRGGTGLGLAITKSLIDLMGGHIEVNSRVGRGSTFTFRIPLSRPEAGDFSAISPMSLIGFPPLVLTPLLQALTERGCAVHAHDSWPEAPLTNGLVVVYGEALAHQDASRLLQCVEQGGRLLIATAASQPRDLPDGLHNHATVMAGPLSPMRLLHAARLMPGRLAQTVQRLNGVRVLAAEDNPVNRLVLAQMLEQEGASVTFAFDGAHAIEQVRAHGQASFDVVLCDIQMPVMDGYETTQALSQLAPTLPVIGLTAHAFDSAKQQARLVGMVGYVTKPYMLDTLVDEIRRYARPRPSDPAAPATSPESQAPSMTPQAPMQHNTNDWQAMQQYFREQPQLLDKLIAMLTDTLTDIQHELDQAMSGQNLEALAKVAHNIKGTALNLHTPELARLAVQTQEQARQATQDALQTAHLLSQRLHDFIEMASAHQSRALAAANPPAPLPQAVLDAHHQAPHQ